MVSGARLTPRAQVRSLLGSDGRRGAAPLFVPLMHVLAAKVEALDIGECLTNPTKLAKGLQAPAHRSRHWLDFLARKE